MCDSVHVQPSLPRLCGHQRHRANVPVQISIWLFSTYHLNTDQRSLALRNGEKVWPPTANSITGLYLVPSVLVGKTIEEDSVVGRFVQWWPSFLQQSFERVSLLVHEVEKPGKDHVLASLPTSLHHMLPQTSPLFPNITVLLQFCVRSRWRRALERAFSGLKRIKTPLRSTMGNERLSLCLIHIHSDIGIISTK